MGLINWIFDFYQQSKIMDAQDANDVMALESATVMGTA